MAFAVKARGAGCVRHLHFQPLQMGNLNFSEEILLSRAPTHCEPKQNTQLQAQRHLET